MAQLPRVVRLSNGAEMPRLGLGTYRCQGAAVRAAVAAALQAVPAGDVLHVDTASAYRNEHDIGAELLGVPRSRLFVTSKVSPQEQGEAQASTAVHGMLERLGLESLDAVLVHWPGAHKTQPTSPLNAQLRAGTWRALEALHRDGKVRSLGVSNYTVKHLSELLATCSVRPVVNQVELHPLLQQHELVDFCAAQGIAVVAYSPLGAGVLLKHPDVLSVAQESGRTAAQVLLRWSMQAGLCCVAKSATSERVASNFDVWDWALSAEHLARLDGMEARHGSKHFCWDSTAVL